MLKSLCCSPKKKHKKYKKLMKNSIWKTVWLPFDQNFNGNGIVKSCVWCLFSFSIRQGIHLLHFIFNQFNCFRLVYRTHCVDSIFSITDLSLWWRIIIFQQFLSSRKRQLTKIASSDKCQINFIGNIDNLPPKSY